MQDHSQVVNQDLSQIFKPLKDIVMEKEIKAPNKTLVIILYIVSALFLIYGVFALISSIAYISNYSSYGNVTGTNMLQYVITECADYFGFGILIFASAKILKILSLKSFVPSEAPASADTEDVLASEATDEDIQNTEDSNEVQAPEEETAEEETGEEETPQDLSKDTFKNIFENK